MPTAAYEARLARARAILRDAGVDGLLVVSQYNRRYLTGFAHADGDFTESAGSVLVTPDLLALVTGTFFLSGLEHEVEPSGAEVLLADVQPVPRVLAEAIARQGIRRLGFEKEWMSYARYEQLRNAVAAEVELVPCDDLIERVRIPKDSTELAIMRRAADIANSAFAQLVTELRPGMTERQIAFRLEELMLLRGASGPSFPTIVAGGPGGALPHAVPTEREIRTGEPLLIDFGCKVDGYCSDLTRTICLGEPEPRLAEIYAVVRAAQDAGEQALRDGARRGREVDIAARKVIAEAGYGDQFIHSLGHGVGLAIHELPALASPRGDDPQRDAELAKVEQLPAGAVVTVEPGIYLPGWGGVRLEDMAHVTEAGMELLTDRNPERILTVPVV
jgi:Xaa-Pro aminopeptidase